MRSNDNIILLEKELQSETKRRLIEEFIPRIIQCLEVLDEEQIWYRPNPISNSIGNLVLHIEGNARQWLVSALGGSPDFRNRKSEFDEKGPLPKSLLITKLNLLEKDILKTVDQINLPNLLLKRNVQIFNESGVSILIHAIEHFSYHTGQIAFATKMLTSAPLNFYGDLNL
jgi:uncharacterized damage-inducible protein DinB